MSTGEAPRGPALVFTTPYLRKAPRRIALSTQAFSLPGTYQLSRVVGAVVGGLVFAIPGFILIGLLGTWYPLIGLVTIGGIFGVGATTWKSSTGESAAQWALLFAAKRTGLVKVSGRWVRAYVGACRLERAAFGPVQVIAESDEAMTAAELHGKFIVAAPLRPRSRPAGPRAVDSASAVQETTPTRAPRRSSRAIEALSRAGAAVREARTQARRQRARAARAEGRPSQRTANARAGMTAATRLDSTIPSAARPSPPTVAAERAIARPPAVRPRTEPAIRPIPPPRRGR